MKFADNNFVDCKSKPRILKLDDNLFIALYHCDMDDETVNTFVYQQVIISAVVNVRTALINHKYPSGINENEINPYQHIAIIQDGANGQIKCLENTVVDYCQENKLDITFCKFADGTSLTESPNDKGVMHASLHRY